MMSMIPKYRPASPKFMGKKDRWQIQSQAQLNRLASQLLR